MPGLTYTRSKSLAGLGHLRNQFDYGTDYYKTPCRKSSIDWLRFRGCRRASIRSSPPTRPSES